MVPVEGYRGGPAVADTSLLCSRYNVIRRHGINRRGERRREGVRGEVKVRDDIDVGINIIVRKNVRLHLAAPRSGPRHYVAK